MLVKLLESENPDYIAVAFDMPAATFRHEAYEDYKAHRAPMPDTRDAVGLKPTIRSSRARAWGCSMGVSRGFARQCRRAGAKMGS